MREKGIYDGKSCLGEGKRGCLRQFTTCNPRVYLSAPSSSVNHKIFSSLLSGIILKRQFRLLGGTIGALLFSSLEATKSEK